MEEEIWNMRKTELFCWVWRWRKVTLSRGIQEAFTSREWPSPGRQWRKGGPEPYKLEEVNSANNLKKRVSRFFLRASRMQMISANPLILALWELCQISDIQNCKLIYVLFISHWSNLLWQKQKTNTYIYIIFTLTGSIYRHVTLCINLYSPYIPCLLSS